MKKPATYNHTIPTSFLDPFSYIALQVLVYEHMYTVVIILWTIFTSNFLYHLGFLPVELNFHAN